MNILIIENEPASAGQLKDIVSEVRSDCHFLPVSSSVADSVRCLEQNTPDLIFMDIELSDGSAFDIFNEVTVKSPVIFTTAFNEHITRAFDNNGMDYLLKPVNPEMVTKAFRNYERYKSIFGSNKSYDFNFLKKASVNTSYKSQFLVKHGQKLIPVKIADINHFSSDGNLVYLVTQDKRKYVIDENLGELEIILNPSLFFRVNRKFLVAKEAILSLDQYSPGQVSVNVHLLESEKIVVSRQQTKLLKNWLNQ